MKKENGVVLLYHLFGLGWLVGWIHLVGLVLVSVLAWAFHLELFRTAPPYLGIAMAMAMVFRSVLVCYHVTSTVYRVFFGLHIHKK